MLKSSNSGQACKRRRGLRGAGLAAAAAMVLGFAAAPSGAPLTGSASLTVAYASILAARFDRADAAIRDACPPAPAEACQVLGVVSLWWRIQIDPDNRTLDSLLNERARAAVSAAVAWTKREPRNAEAWFYLAGSYAPLVQWQALRKERVAAARNGNRVRVALEEALRLDPDMADAHFGIGIYEYYADVASAAAKVFRWLLLLPGGDRVKGLQEIDKTRLAGGLLRAEAEYQRYLIDIWYEHTPDDALAILRSLDARYPTNPLFLQRIAELSDTYLHDTSASAATWQTLGDRAARGRVYDAARVAALAERRRRALF